MGGEVRQGNPQSSSRRRAPTLRSASSPPSFPGGAESRSGSRSRSKVTGISGDAEKADGGDKDNEKVNGGRETSGGYNSRKDSSTTRYTDPQAVYKNEAELGDEDFVEGGVELLPSEGGAELAQNDIPPPRPTRKLPAHGDPDLEEFWRKGSGVRALFLDYDGTLREFENRPELATPTPELEELLDALNSREDIIPHIISGRDAPFLESCFSKYKRFTLIAEHGFQIWRPASKEARRWELTDHPDGLDNDHEDWKVLVRKSMSTFVARISNSWIEEKSSSLVWHYREALDQDMAEMVAEEAHEELERLRDREKINKIRVSNGHKVVEVSYRKVRKGPCMRRICEEKALFGEPFLSVLVAGDDVSDESMFDIAPAEFLTIKVGQAPTLASFRVESPAALRSFLWQLLNS